MKQNLSPTTAVIILVVVVALVALVGYRLFLAKPGGGSSRFTAQHPSAGMMLSTGRTGGSGGAMSGSAGMMSGGGYGSGGYSSGGAMPGSGGSLVAPGSGGVPAVPQSR